MTEIDYADIAALAREAAAMMAKHGKCEGVMINEEGKVCFLGAIKAATLAREGQEYTFDLPGAQHFGEYKPTTPWMVIYDKATEILRLRDSRDGDPVSWNNKPETTGAEVQALLIETAGALAHEN